MGKKRVCPKCGTIVGEFTYFCTECGAKTEEYHDQPNQAAPSGPAKPPVNSLTPKPGSTAPSQNEGTATSGTAMALTPKTLESSPMPGAETPEKLEKPGAPGTRRTPETSPSEATVKPEQASPPASPKKRSNVKYIVLGAVALIVAVGLFAGLNKGGKQESKKESAKTTTAAPVRTEKHIEESDPEETGATEDLSAYVDVNEPNDSPETAVRVEDGGTYYGYLSSQDDRDYFVIYSEQETPVFITFTHEPVHGGDAVGWEISSMEDGVETSAMSRLGEDTVTIRYMLKTGENYLFIKNGRPQEEYAGIADVVPKMEYGITFNYPKYASDYILPMSDRIYLTEDDLKALTQDELRLARNELYARHGRLFKDQELQAYFNRFDWYDGRIAPDQFSDSMLNPYEVANRDLIVAYEEKMGYH